MADPRAATRHRMVGSAALWQMKRRFQVQFLRGHGLQPGESLLDLGCGTLRGGIPLIEYLDAGRYVGLDIRREAIEEAKAELALHHLEGKGAHLRAVDRLAGLELGRRFDAIWAFSVLIHMDDARLDEALAFVSRHLGRDGVFFANVNIGKRSAGGWQGFPVVWRPLAEYRAVADQRGLTLQDLGPLDALGHVSGVPAQDAQRMLVLRHA